MIYSFVLDDSLTSWRFTTRTEQLTKCCEPLQKMRVRLGPCKTGLSPPPLVIVYYRSFQSDTSVVVLIVLCFGVDFCAVWALCTFSYFSSVPVTEWPPIGE